MDGRPQVCQKFGPSRKCKEAISYCVKHTLYNLFCCNSGEYEKQFFLGDGDSLSDGATVWMGKARGERTVEVGAAILWSSSIFCTITCFACCHWSICNARSAFQLPFFVGPT